MSPDPHACAQSAATWLHDMLPAMEAALAPLVEVNSFTDNPDGGRQVSQMLRALFAIRGLAAKTVPSSRFADHLVFWTKGDATKAPIALVGHLDTVFPPGTFQGYRKDGDLRRGPGVLDMKGGLVVVAYALKALADVTSFDALPPLRIVVVADEEVGSPEGQRVIRDEIAGAKACLVFESGRAGDAIITRRKGTGMIKAVAHGRAAHAGNNHHDGKNAIWALAKFVDAAQRLTDYERGITVNVGKFTGGTSKNTVPDRAEALLDLRFCTRADAEALLTAIRAAASEAGVAIEGTSVDIEGGVARDPMERTAASEALMARYAECAKRAGLGAAESPLLGGGSDASTSSAMGIASIDGLGPRGKGFHTHDELIEVASMVPKAEALARFLATG